LEQLGDHAYYELMHSDVTGDTADVVDALKNSSTLKSLTRIYEHDYDEYDDDDLVKVTIRSTITDALKVNSSLSSLNLEHHYIQDKDSCHLANYGQVNSLIPLDPYQNSIQNKRMPWELLIH
jgi:hypothetical protein